MVEALISTAPAGSTATSVPAPMAMPASALARAGASLTPGRRRLAALPGCGHHRSGQGVLAVGLDRAGQGQQPGLVAVDGGHPGDLRLAPGQGAGLVEQDGVDDPHPLQG
jgi:hypothetical protein